MRDPRPFISAKGATTTTGTNHENPRVLFILGPTGTGKSSLAVSLAKRFNGEIINADAIQLYQGLPIITNKISVEEQQGIPHHLLGVIGLEEEAWTVHRYVREARRVIGEVHERGRLPVVCGGTGYYSHAILCGGALLAQEEKIDGGEEEESSEAEVDGHAGGGIEEAKKRWPILAASSEEMHAALKRLDPDMADTWHPKDYRRVQRSLEICLRTGRKVSEIYQEQKEADDTTLNYDPLLLWLQAEDGVLKARLDARVHDMVKNGLFEEALTLAQFEASQTARGRAVDKTRGIWVSIGYKETQNWTTAQLARSDEPIETAKQSPLAQSCIEAVQAGTRQYAKRQERYIRVSFAKSLQRACSSERLFLLDGTDLSKFHSDLVPEAAQLTQAWLSDDALPDPSSLSSLAAETFAKVRGGSPQRSMRVKHFCEVCKRTLMTEHEWEVHMNGRGHKRAVAGRKKHEAALQYIEKRGRREASEVRVESEGESIML
ncbi:tRNA dimethylallyltransferase, mitochondrial [Cyphellophora attinorum]|uniref:tRNA dimethylallyltransferase, mitochondrial n=1 Tax=Cyphellophora attinorum TaxID=1664694 RepID=A0A0N0NNN7_9EURO|nr:tRNA dimethylallyltransferase, mitochondrial [Phialophora attinorum]KPI41758.1 tRNA dimethylallyltransferase, mitochondrial [Phialophora attinorum]